MLAESLLPPYKPPDASHLLRTGQISYHGRQMILSALVIAPTALMGAQSVKDLAIRWRSGASHLSLATATSMKLGGSTTPVQVTGAFKQSPGLKQRYEIFYQGRSYGQVQSGTNVMSWDGETKKYATYTGVNRLGGPTPLAPTLLNYSFPTALMDRTMQDLKDPAWKTKGSEMSRQGETQFGRFEYRLTFGPQGEPLKLFVKVEGEFSYEASTVFSAHSTQPVPDGVYSLRPFLGWTPLYVPEANFSLEAGSKAPAKRFKDGLTGRSFGLMDGALGKGAALVFVDPECPVSVRLMARLAPLREALKKKGLSLKVISVGPVRPSAWAASVAWDQSGEIERAFSLASTPFLCSIDKKGVVAGAWLGFSAGEEAKIAGILVPREPEKD